METSSAAPREAAGPTLARNILIIACAVSAGVHAGLVPAHFAEGRSLGIAFALAALLLLAVSVALAAPATRAGWPP